MSRNTQSMLIRKDSDMMLTTRSSASTPGGNTTYSTNSERFAYCPARPVAIGIPLMVILGNFLRKVAAVLRMSCWIAYELEQCWIQCQGCHFPLSDDKALEDKQPHLAYLALL